MQKQGGGSDSSAKTSPKQKGTKSPLRFKTMVGMAPQAPFRQQPLEEPAVEAEPFRIRNYEPVEELGRGGMGIVYKAMQVFETSQTTTKPKRMVALKVINFDSSSANESEKRRMWCERFATEAALVMQLDHRNIIRIDDFGEDTKSGDLYFSMELLKGMDLEERIEGGGPLKWPAAKDIILQVCSALDYAHNYVDRETEEKTPIIHRDIKPANIFITKESDGSVLVKVLDFGLAKMFTERGEELTQKGEGAGGTPQYSPPEQLFPCEDIDHRADIYSLGVVMYEMLTGSMPFQFWAYDEENYPGLPEEYERYLHKAYNDFRNRVMDEMPKPMREAAPQLGIPEELDRVVLKCLAKNPKYRFQTVREVMEALEKINGAKSKPEKKPDLVGKDLPSVIISSDISDSPTLQVPGGAPAETEARQPEEHAPAGMRDEKTLIVRDRITIRDSHPAGAAVAQETGAPQSGNGAMSMNGDMDDARTIERPVPARKKAAGRFGKYLLAGSLAAAIGLGGAYLLSGRGGEEGGRTPEARPAQTLPNRETDASDAVARRADTPREDATAPLTEPMVLDAGAEAADDTVPEAPAPDAREVEHAVTLRTGVRGVDVVLNGSVACTTEGDGTCVLRFPEDASPATLTFRKRGYETVRRRVNPDRDQELEVSMERSRPQPAKTPPQQGTHRPLITNER